MDLTLSEVAAQLRVSRKTIYRWIQEQRLPAYRMGRQFRFSQLDIDTWLQTNRMEVQPPGENGASRAAKMTQSLADLLKRGGIYYKVDGVSKEEAIANAVDAMVLPSGVPASQFLQMVLQRERLASTALGRGIAFPHPRVPFQLHPEQCAISICFLEKPVDFGSLDGQFAHILFFAFPENLQHHLQLEAKICYMCRDHGFTAFLSVQPGRREIMEYVEKFEARE